MTLTLLALIRGVCSLWRKGKEMIAGPTPQCERRAKLFSYLEVKAYKSPRRRLLKRFAMRIVNVGELFTVALAPSNHVCS